MLQIQGHSDLFLILEVIKKIIGLVPLFVGAFIGIIPMLYASLLINVISFFLNSYYTGKNLGYTSWMQIKDVAPSYGIAIIVALSVFFIKDLPMSPWIILPIQIAVGVAVFFWGCHVFQLEEYGEIVKLLKPIYNKISIIPINKNYE